VDEDDPEALAPGTGRIVSLSATGAVTPASCACCLAPPTSSQREDRGAESLIIPYCGECLRHASARTTRNLAVVVASLLIAGTLSFALPILSGALPLVPDVVVVLVLALLPVLVRSTLRMRPRPNHSSRERAAWWIADGQLACTNARWAGELGRANSAELRAAALPRAPFPLWLGLGPVSALVMAPFGWYLHHPLVRVLDLNETRIVLTVDGRPVTSVEPTSSESPLAGVEVRIPAGEHDLAAIASDGRELHRARVRIQSGRRHLYAPSGVRHCFWLEETRYGRLGSELGAIDPLTGSARFWVLPRRVDTWFAPNPEPRADRQSSGGVLVALRQSPCSEAPPARTP
jgi:hypothetical protein